VRPWCWSLKRPVRRDLLEQAAAPIVGEHSFEAFAKAGQPERGTRCTVRSTRWETWSAHGSELGVSFTIVADRYLHHMVRYLVGTMVEMAREVRPLEDLPALLAAGPTPERQTSPPAPARGLFLAVVEYPDAALATTDESLKEAR
jgi:tRNA pseudouridine38-40 synthase